MSDPSATYAFLPWFRRGVSADIERIDGAGPQGPRATFPVTLVFNAGTLEEQVTARLSLHGPGEVAGIDRRVIIRTDPGPDVFDAESNYFPQLEFDQPDFPWRYTPASATAGDRLRPWLALIALSDAEIAAATAADAARGTLPSVTVADGRLLPNLAQSWAWAHVQISGLDRGDAADAAKIKGIDENEPHRMLSRLLCARRLRPRTAYTAYLVPTFERGRLAGLDEAVNDTIDALAPAWQTGSGDAVVLPVYYQWRFQTAEAGDFKSLVRALLPPRVLSEAVGRRPMDASHPGADLSPATSAGGGPLTLEGALISPASRETSPQWTNRQPFVGELEDLVNAPAQLLADGAGRRVIAPPLYGRWHAARTRLQAAAAPSWFDELNGDPQLRAVAGLGARVVQEQQNQLLAAAWEQVEGILAANKQMREAQLGVAVATRLVERDLLALDPATAIQITAPILARVFASPRTILATLRDSPIPSGALDPQFRRASRPLGPIGRKQARITGGRGRFGVPSGRTGLILERLNRGELPHRPPPASAKLPSIEKGARRLMPSQAWWSRIPFAVLVLLAIALLALAAIVPTTVVSAALAGFGLAVGGVAWASQREAQRWASRGEVQRRDLLAGLQTSQLSGSAVRAMTPARGFTPSERGFPAAGATATDPARAVANFQSAFAVLADRLRREPSAPVQKQSADLSDLQSKVMAAIRPETAIVRAMDRRVRLVAGGVDRDSASCGPIMAAPTFDQPMYQPLRDLSQEWLLPGIGEIPPNTVSLVVSNQRFVESYMVGLNHEMGRELLWHEYPTDQRGTYFRQFWDVRGYAGPADTQLHDIAPIHTWTRSTALGTHRPGAPSSAEHLVLLVRGQLLRRYPNTVIYAIRATLPFSTPVAEGGKRTLGNTERFPLFHGTLAPDIAFIGFDFTREEVAGNDASTASADQGWFFVFQEQPAAPRFGLNVPAGPLGGSVPAWADLSWGHLVLTPEDLEAMTYINLDPPPRYPGDTEISPLTPAAPVGEPHLAWHAAAGSKSSDLAYITLRKPFRVAIHGSDLLP